MGFFRQDLKEETCIPDMAPKRRFFCKFLGINTHNLVKNDSNFESKGLFDAKFYGTWHEKIFRSRNPDVWGLGPKN